RNTMWMSLAAVFGGRAAATIGTSISRTRGGITNIAIAAPIKPPPKPIIKSGLLATRTGLTSSERNMTARGCKARARQTANVDAILPRVFSARHAACGYLIGECLRGEQALS